MFPQRNFNYRAISLHRLQCVSSKANLSKKQKKTKNNFYELNGLLESIDYNAVLHDNYITYSKAKVYAAELISPMNMNSNIFTQQTMKGKWYKTIPLIQLIHLITPNITIV